MRAVETEFSTRDGGHYVPGMVHNGLLFISGQLSTNPETGEKAGNVFDEARQALKNLNLVLTEAGCTKDDVLHCRVYIPDVEYWPELNKAYAEYFGNHKPARVVVPSNNLYDGCLVEIEAIAQVRD